MLEEAEDTDPFTTRLLSFQQVRYHHTIIPVCDETPNLNNATTKTFSDTNFFQDRIQEFLYV